MQLQLKLAVLDSLRQNQLHYGFSADLPSLRLPPLLLSPPAQPPPAYIKQYSYPDNTPSQPLKLLFDNRRSGFVWQILTTNPNMCLGRKNIVGNFNV